MIKGPYILFSRIPLVKDDHGHLFTDPLWAKDIELHLDYIQHFGMCCPVERNNVTTGLQDISKLDIKWLYALRNDHGLTSILKNLLPNFLTVIKACRKARIVHSDGAGWSFPLSFYLLPLKPLMRFQWIIVIESSFWMLAPGEARSFRKTVEHHAHKILLTRCLKLANARIFTQSFYKEYFLGNDNRRTLINHASWVDKQHMSSADAVNAKFADKPAGTLNLFYPSRLVSDKGVLVVLDAIEQLKDDDLHVNITIMGAGDLKAHCQRFAAADHGAIKVSFQNPVDYGAAFFRVIAEHDWLLVPTLKQEQPRIVFDAFSQGVPVIASDTRGILDITDKDNALTFETGNPSSLADAIRHAARHRHLALSMGLAGLQYASARTHLQMHQDREQFLKNTLDPCTST